MTEENRARDKTLSRLVVFTRKVLDKQACKAILACSLTMALVGGPLWSLLDIPDDPGLHVLDAISCLILVIFTVEIIANSVASSDYRLSFFFWMDIVGTLSMVFEVSFLLGGLAEIDAVVLRSARAAKLGARVGRLLKVLKYIQGFARFLTEPMTSRKNVSSGVQECDEAHLLAHRLTSTIATRVSLVTILMVVFLPLIEMPLFPTSDKSLELWADDLERAYFMDLQQIGNSTNFQAAVGRITVFYSNDRYHPFEIQGFPSSLELGGVSYQIPGQALLQKGEPKRKQNLLEYSVSTCQVIRPDCDHDSKPYIKFDFTASNQLEAGLDLVLIIFIIGIMVVMTFDTRKVLDNLLVQPLENMLSHLRMHAQAVVRTLDPDSDAETDDAGGTELETLSRILRKLSRIASIATGRNIMHERSIENTDAEGKGVLVDLIGVKVITENTEAFASSLCEGSEENEQWVQTWDFDILAFSEIGLLRFVKHMFLSSQFGLAPHFAKHGVFQNFMTEVHAGYKDVPYHCYAHACDVLHTVYRFMCLSRSGQWMSKMDQYGLLIAAYCHDLGHFGKSNAFLVETDDPLAIRYNDRSPLENMHAAKLFKICQQPKTNIFGNSTKEDAKECRKVCVATILDTDNAKHFSMVKDMTHIYEMTEHICAKQALAEDDALEPQYKSDVLNANKLPLLGMLLHLADVSNPLKPFQICHAWAWRVLDEYFAQGDEEKELGLPVGMLNDRNKISRPGSQHGFINFLVAPLLLSATNLFPVFSDLHVQMCANLREWRNIWIEEARPTKEDIVKKDADVRKIRDITQHLQRRRFPGKELDNNDVDRRPSQSSRTSSRPSTRPSLMSNAAAASTRPSLVSNAASRHSTVRA